MIFGAITNSWRDQIFTTDLPRLVERARRRGVTHIELRQTCLGQYEQGAGDDWRPVTDKLARLGRTFPVLTFNLAIAYPCLTREPDPASPLIQASLEAAKAVGTLAPKLRMVDTGEFDGPWERPTDVEAAAARVAELARESARQEVRLFMENSGQPIRSMALVVQEARKQLTVQEAAYLGLCVDPINSLRADPDSDPITEVEALPLDYIFMVHFKQTADGQLLPKITDGDLSYPRLLQTLQQKGYDDLAIIEIPSGEEVFEHIRESVEYLERLMGGGASS